MSLLNPCLPIYSYNITVNVIDEDDMCPRIALDNNTQLPIFVRENDPVLINYVTVDPDTDHTNLTFTRDPIKSNDTWNTLTINSTGVFPGTNELIYIPCSTNP